MSAASDDPIVHGNSRSHDALRAWAAGLVECVATDARPQDLTRLRQQACALATEPTARVVPAAAGGGPDPVVIRDEESLVALAAGVAAAGDIVVDLETSGLDPRAGLIVGIGLALAHASYYVPVGHCFENGHLRPHQMVLADVLAALRLQTKPLVAHNAKFELRWLRHHGAACRIVWDTMVAAKLLRSDLPADLEAVAARELDVPGWALPSADIRRVQFLHIDRVAAYCCKDAWYTRKVFEKQREVLR